MRTYRRVYKDSFVVLYGLVDQGPVAALGFVLREETGLLVAFSPYVAHKIKPVLVAERFSIAKFPESHARNKVPAQSAK